MANSDHVEIRSIGLRSDLALIDGEILNRDTYLVVRSPQEPSYYWGNLLVFPDPPKDGDRERWESCFEREFSDLPGVQHQTFAWDCSSNPGEVDAFVEAGYQHERTVVLTASSVQQPPHHNAALDVRVIRSQDEWDQVAEQQVESRDPEHEEVDYRKFVTRRLAKYRGRIDAGQGQWYGAFRNKELLAHLGIFRSAKAARFQVVITRPDARRQGVCGTLVYQVAKATLSDPDVDSLVMLADSEYHAARIYESVGFVATESLEGLCRWPR